jgi:glycosyltransferase involved in cell wall biosynthesis
MNVLVTIEARFDRTPNGAIWTHTVFARPFWDRYLDVFEGVRILARVRDVAQVPPDWLRVDGGAVRFAPVPHYHGPWEYCRKRLRVVRAVGQAIHEGDAVILRVPSLLASILQPHVRRQRRPYAVEVIGDPYDIFAPGAIRHPLRPVLRRWMVSRLRAQCRAAIAAGYVTDHVLQQRYPASADAMATHYSSIDLDRAAFVDAPRPVRCSSGPRTLIGVGSLAQLYKGPDVLVDAVRALVDNAVDVRMVWLGDGWYRPALEEHARHQHVSDRVRFAGELLPGERVRAGLDRADLFVMPSRTEGLPRAMLEAMARGLPCIGSRVGGIQELLALEDTVEPGNATALAAKVREVLNDPSRLAQMSARNLAKASEYRSDILRARRISLYRHLREVTEAWYRRGDVAASVLTPV